MKNELENKLDLVEILPEGEVEFCKYIHKCNKPCFQVKAQACGLRRFYDKYPDYEKMFGGSKK
jgi:hypothetical protein